MDDEKTELRFLHCEEESGFDEDLAESPDMRLLATCVVSQQRAGFRDVVDLRVCRCPDCNSKGFNTGWGYWLFSCGAEILSDGTPGEPCSAKQATGED
ncbi:MAG: hypothetical protein L6Q71_09195 [Planctomycetes bacterium]|nr:hypothetical protein [Planctomycetota bacterium]